MALAQKAKKGQKNENRLKQNFVPMPRTHDFGHKTVVSTWWLKWDFIVRFSQFIDQNITQWVQNLSEVYDMCTVPAWYV